MLNHLSGATRLFPIIGDPIAAVQSPAQLTRGFARRGHNAVCIPVQVPVPAFDAVMRGLSVTPNVDGLLVTMPHKSATFERCATSSDTSRLLRAVSVMRRNPDGTWHGDMLDGRAFVDAQMAAGARPDGARVLLVGAGSAGAAIAHALLQAGVRHLVVHDTDEARAGRLVALLRHRGHGGQVEPGPPDPAGCDMICNASPAGMQDGDPLPVPAGSLAAPMFVGDVVAGHGLTPLLRAAQEAGCKTANGVQMVDAVQEAMLDFMLGAGA